MNAARVFALTLIWVAGIATIIGSQLKEDKPPPPPPVPVTVQFALTSNDLKRDLGAREAELSALELKGSYSANQGDTLTLDRNSIVLDTDSTFSIAIEGDDLLIGQSVIDVTDVLDVGLDHNPVGGQFTSLYDDTTTAATTTTVTVTTSGVDVLVEGPGATADPYSWSAFEALEDDTDADLNLRMASAAYNMFDIVLRATRLVEDIIDDIESNKTTLEGMLDEPLPLTCNNSGSGIEYTLEWTLDAAGAGQGVIGDNDQFETIYENCEDASRAYFLDGFVELDNYNPAETGVLSTLGMDADFLRLFLSTTANPTTESADSPRINGLLKLNYTERAITR